MPSRLASIQGDSQTEKAFSTARLPVVRRRARQANVLFPFPISYVVPAVCVYLIVFIRMCVCVCESVWCALRLCICVTNRVNRVDNTPQVCEAPLSLRMPMANTIAKLTHSKCLPCV